MARKNRTIPDKRIWTAYLIIGVLLMAGVAFFSSWRAMRTAEERFCQTLEFVKSQSTSFEKYNDTVVAKIPSRQRHSAARRSQSISWQRILRLTSPTRSA